jgi:hypothetical protein
MRTSYRLACDFLGERNVPAALRTGHFHLAHRTFWLRSAACYTSKTGTQRQAKRPRRPHHITLRPFLEPRSLGMPIVSRGAHFLGLANAHAQESSKRMMNDGR